MEQAGGSYGAKKVGEFLKQAATERGSERAVRQGAPEGERAFGKGGGEAAWEAPP